MREEDSVLVYFLLNGRFAGKARAKLGTSASSYLRSRVKAVFFREQPPSKRATNPREEEIVSRWLRANRKHLNAVDVDHAGPLPEVMDRLNDYLNDPGRLTDIVFFR